MLAFGAQANLIDDSYGAGAGSFELSSNDPPTNPPGFFGLDPDSTVIRGWTVGEPGDGIDYSRPVFR